MLKVIEGSFEKLKDEMNLRKQTIDFQIKDIKSKQRKKDTNSHVRAQLQSKIDELQDLKKIYMPTKTLPVRVDDVIINYKAYQSFLKKVSKFQPNTVFREGVLCLEYQTSPTTGGSLEFHDLNNHFKGFEHIPVVGLDGAVS